MPSWSPNVLQYMKTYRLPAEKCPAEAAHHSGTKDDDNFCTIHDSKYMTEQTSKEPCAAPGDSGGPLVCFKYEKRDLISKSVSIYSFLQIAIMNFFTLV